MRSGWTDRNGSTPGSPHGTFDLLGFTHYWGKFQKGHWVVKRKTASGRFARAVRAISPWCRFHRHLPIGEQHRILSQKLRGHFAYYGLTGNGKALSRFQFTVTRLWRKWLSRRRRGYAYPWSRFVRLLERFPLPAAIVVHSVYRRVANS